MYDTGNDILKTPKLSGNFQWASRETVICEENDSLYEKTQSMSFVRYCCPIEEIGWVYWGIGDLLSGCLCRTIELLGIFRFEWLGALNFFSDPFLFETVRLRANLSENLRNISSMEESGSSSDCRPLLVIGFVS
jgi:hypothetical protein